MSVELQHPMNPQKTADEAARGRFVSGMRSLILNDLAADMKAAYDRRAVPAWERSHGAPPQSSADHRAGASLNRRAA